MAKKFSKKGFSKSLSRGLKSSKSSRGAKVSRRNKALGRTPAKNSPTGARVIQRWHQRQLNNPSNSKYQKVKWIGKGSEPPATNNHTQLHPAYQNPDNWQVKLRKTPSGQREWVNLNQSNVHMGHKLSAVDYWQNGAKGHTNKHGVAKPKYQQRYQPYTTPGYQAADQFKSPIHRRFMQDPANYRFEWGSANSSDGARMKNSGKTYQSLPKNEPSW